MSIKEEIKEYIINLYGDCYTKHNDYDGIVYYYDENYNTKEKVYRITKKNKPVCSYNNNLIVFTHYYLKDYVTFDRVLLNYLEKKFITHYYIGDIVSEVLGTLFDVEELEFFDVSYYLSTN